MGFLRVFRMPSTVRVWCDFKSYQCHRKAKMHETMAMIELSKTNQLENHQHAREATTKKSTSWRLSPRKKNHLESETIRCRPSSNVSNRIDDDHRNSVVVSFRYWWWRMSFLQILKNVRTRRCCGQASSRSLLTNENSSRGLPRNISCQNRNQWNL